MLALRGRNAAARPAQRRPLSKRSTNQQTLTLLNATIRSNIAGLGGGVSGHNVGGLRSLTKMTITATNSSFVSNRATTIGGGVNIDGLGGGFGAGAELSNTYTAALNSCVFQSNQGGSAVAGAGGAVAVANGAFAIADCVFDSNTAVSGSALAYSGTSATLPVSTVQGSRFTGGIATGVTVVLDATMRWICSPGQYGPTSGSIRGNFDGCLSCMPGYYSNSTDENRVDCTDYGSTCDSGFYCPSGSYEPTPCPNGTRRVLSECPSIGRRL